MIKELLVKDHNFSEEEAEMAMNMPIDKFIVIFLNKKKAREIYEAED